MHAPRRPPLRCWSGPAQSSPASACPAACAPAITRRTNHGTRHRIDSAAAWWGSSKTTLLAVMLCLQPQGAATAAHLPLPSAAAELAVVTASSHLCLATLAQVLERICHVRVVVGLAGACIGSSKAWRSERMTLQARQHQSLANAGRLPAQPMPLFCVLSATILLGLSCPPGTSMVDRPLPCPAASTSSYGQNARSARPPAGRLCTR